MEVIMPCAGLSTRFPNLRPKYLLTDYSGKMMIENAAKNYIGKHNVTVIILQEHNKRFNAEKKLREAFGDSINIVVLENTTTGPADTAYQGIIKGNINLSSEILIKDCDGFYDAEYIPGNAIYVSKLSKNPNIRNAPAKSYTISNEQNIITTVIEKQIVSNNFCVGGYQFDTAQLFIFAFEKLRDTHNSEIFVSNIIDFLISQGTIFVENEVDNFIDVGTSQDWFEYNNKPTYFCDIDGTIIKSKDSYYDPYEPLQNNVDKLLYELSRGCKIVFCTARPRKFEEITRTMLDELGFKDCILIMEVNHSKRILVNDYAHSNPYPSAEAVNIKRDADILGELL